MLLPDSIHTPDGEATDKPPRFHHVLLTRFNMRVFRDRRALHTPAEVRRWMEHRVPVFRDVCLPSVLGQDRMPKLWLIGMDETEPDQVTELLELLAPHPWIQPAWQKSPGGQPESTKATFARALGLHKPEKNYHHLMTTRLDNDDALNRYYFRWVERYAASCLRARPELEDFWLSFPMGAQLHGGRFYQYNHTRGHFLTRCVQRQVAGVRSTTTSLSIRHTTVFDQDGPVFTPLTKTPMWLENIHELNVMNSLLARPLELTPTEDVAALFSLSRGAAAAGAVSAEPGDGRRGALHRLGPRRRAAPPGPGSAAED